LEVVARFLDYGVAGSVFGAVLWWFAKRAERRLRAMATQIRVLTVIICEAHGVDKDRISELEHLMNGGKG
jgi:hypothetical protein